MELQLSNIFQTATLNTKLLINYQYTYASLPYRVVQSSCPFFVLKILQLLTAVEFLVTTIILKSHIVAIAYLNTIQ